MFGLGKRKDRSIQSPIDGLVISLDDVKDDMFSKRMLGDGVAIVPTNHEVLSPIEGTIEMISPTLHAIGIKAKDGLELLIHVGLDTVQLKGQGFTSYVQVGDQVKVGQALLSFDEHFLRENKLDMTTPVIVIADNGHPFYLNNQLGKVVAGRTSIIWYK